MKFFLLLFGVCSVFSMDIVVPAYFDPSGTELTYWNQMIVAAKAGTPVTVIMNPNSGPGTTVDSSYTFALLKMKSAGATVVGYVSSVYGQRAISSVKSDIDKYRTFYKVDGFFIDEMNNTDSTQTVNYYKSIYTYVKGLDNSLMVIDNPGYRIPQTFLTTRVADRFMIFETNQKQYPSPPYSQPSWQNNHAPYNFIHCVYNATQGEMSNDVVLANQRRAGGIYVTNDKLNNPYDTLPTYWNQLVTEVNNINSSG